MIVKDQGVHLVLKGEKIVGFFTRDEETNENIIFIASKASLDEIKELLTRDDEKI